MPQPDPTTATSLYQFEAQFPDGQTMPLSEHAGKVALVVNTASKCGFTPQFEALQKLYDLYAEQGFVIFGFPSAQFKQEFSDPNAPGSYCQKKFGVTFPMFATTDVNGGEAHPVFEWLKNNQPGTLGKAFGGRLGSAEIKWNFTKFLVGRNGRVIARYAPVTAPEKIAPEIEGALSAGS